MRITYIKHSAFLVEWEDVACLFDYAEGELPEIPDGKRLCIFASHHHADHFNPEIFRLFAAHPKHTFILSEDIRTVPTGEKAPIVRTGADCRRIFPGGRMGPMSVSTVGSTDCGVAFVVNYAGKTVYHAGDLHWWAWPDDTPEEERDMKNHYFAEIAKINGVRLDAAFLPLDPRLGANYWMGFDAMMRTADVRRAFPMHMWEQYESIAKFKAMSVTESYRNKIADITAPNQTFEI